MPTHVMLMFAALPMLTCLLGCEMQQSEYQVELPSAKVETRAGPSAEELARPTQVVVLGTGTPIPDGYRAGPGIAIVHQGETYLFDVGAGTVRNATIARYQYDIPSLYPSQICCAFISHLHSDHTLDLAELSYTLWWRRRTGLRVWGPEGVDTLRDGADQMMSIDTQLRSSGVQPLPNPTGNQMQVTEIQEGILFAKDDLVISAFPVPHGDIRPAFGFKIITADKRIVISGDTAFSERLIEEAKGVDLLFHEVISSAGLDKNTRFWQNYHRSAHTTSFDVGRIATAAQPGLLVLYHGLYYGTPEADVVDEVRTQYDGPIVLANDLDVF